jgi:hypothetical protein
MDILWSSVVSVKHKNSGFFWRWQGEYESSTLIVGFSGRGRQRQAPTTSCILFPRFRPASDGQKRAARIRKAEK